MRVQAQARFDRLDANKDGQIDAAEREAARARFAEMRAKWRDARQPAPAGAPTPPPAG
jgi:hypothetical protein